MNRNSATVGHAEFRPACSKSPMDITILTPAGDSGNSIPDDWKAFLPRSLQPPLIFAGINPQSRMMKYLRFRRHFGVNALSESQHKLYCQFAGNWQGRFANVNRHMGSTGVSLFSDVGGIRV
jgi:flavin reductase (DIM6/NTAB) family NADH-FMN oxidoreductase RutF